ncbi:MAG: STAS domain-containing protein [Gammaproteobacteria bacterium]|nr:STAS domain-containing protein [Gammaproteobacteria bacterium]
MSTIEINPAGQFVVIGELSFATVPAINLRGRQLIMASPKPVFDLHNITKSDNAAVALLISWARFAKNHGKSMTFINPPQQILDIAAVSGVSALLPIKEEDTIENNNFK